MTSRIAKRFLSSFAGALTGFALLWLSSKINYSLNFIVDFVTLGKIWIILGIIFIIAGIYANNKKFYKSVVPLFLMSVGTVILGIAILSFLPISEGI